MIRELLSSSEFIIRHKRKPEDFTRLRVFTVPILLTIILRKSLKSMQLTLNEIIALLSKHITSVSNAAYTKARQKIRHTAFIELNQQAVVGLTYAHPHRTYRGYRLLAVDGSKIILPNTDENSATFGSATYANHKEHVHGSHAFALASVLYDVLNNIAVNAALERTDTAEIVAAKQHLPYLTSHDIVVFDRGYCSYVLMAQIATTGADMVIRCSRASFRVANQMFSGTGPDSVVTTLSPPKSTTTSKLTAAKLPTELTMRFVRVVLPTGEIEILATTLLDEQQFPTETFQQLYWHRWGIETFYGTIKTRLSLENFTGTSPESIRQDFFATIFLSGLESLLTADITERLQQKPTKHTQQVNNAVAFHAIKHKAFDLLVSTRKPVHIVRELTALFMTSPTLYRPDKKPERRQSVTRRTVNFFRQKRKIVF